MADSEASELLGEEEFEKTYTLLKEWEGYNCGLAVNLLSDMAKKRKAREEEFQKGDITPEAYEKFKELLEEQISDLFKFHNTIDTYMHQLLNIAEEKAGHSPSTEPTKNFSEKLNQFINATMLTMLSKEPKTEAESPPPSPDTEQS